MRLFDTHAHYNDERFSKEVDLDALFSKIQKENGVRYIVNNGTDIHSSKEVLALSEKYDFCYAAVGVHPEECPEDEKTEDVLLTVRNLLSHPKAVAVGEIGLDYHFEDNPPKTLQMEYFEAQLSLARELKKPVVIHDRDAHGDTFEMLSRFPDVKAVLHSYSGSPEMARQYLRKGNRYISFSGVLTFKNAVAAVETAKIVPKEFLLVETDCPYLAPVPYRGKLNHSGLLCYTLERLAQIKETEIEEMAEITFQNAKTFFEIKE